MNLSLDIIALLWFACCWFGYNLFCDLKANSKHNMIYIMHQNRIAWMLLFNKKVDRSADVNVISVLMRSVSFFASTSILIVVALVGLISSYPEMKHIYKIIPHKSLPFEVNIIEHIWYLKVSVLVTIFIYAFFKFTWALRQYHYSVVLCASTPTCCEENEASKYYAIRNAKVLTNAAKHFTIGMRSYYFGLSTLSWFLSPIIFMITNILILLVLYRREFKSKLLDAISYEMKENEHPAK